MTERFNKYIHENGLLANGDQTLVAASAGVDSTVLCHLFKMAGLPFAIAHCNFKLRGKESDGDEIFMKKWADEVGVPFFSVQFETEKFASERKVSIQMAARELRYNWLNEICQQNDFQKIATAHHLDDNIETVLFNFTKGTGIKGMRGIQPSKNNIIRPILFATKKEIRSFADEHQIAFREDRSNKSDKYTRNKIRHQVVPVLESINPNFQESAGATIGHLGDVEKIYNHAIRSLRKELVSVETDGSNKPVIWKIAIKKLLTSPAPSTVLYELIHGFGFNGSHADQIVQSIENHPGSFFYSPDFRLLIDRENLIVDRQSTPTATILIEHPPIDSAVKMPGGKLTFRQLENRPEHFPKNNATALLDEEKLAWPLTLRHWKEGDVFQPFGMGGKHKKVQDYFTDKKLSRLEKEKTWILESAGKICWIVGLRIDERFKIRASTKRVLAVKFEPTP